MKNLTATICLTIAVLLGSAGVSWSADLQKGVTAYQNGNYATALREWTPLAEQGSAKAQFALGLMYANGQGVLQEHKTAVKWWKFSANQGYAVAQFNLGYMYDEGKGVPQDYKTAVKWYRLAAEQGNVPAQLNLGIMYDEGRGGIQDNVYAHMWYNLAAISGDKDAVTNRDIVAKRMTPSQLEKAQDLARECVRKKYKGC